MKIITSLRNLDSHGQYRAPEVIAEEAPLIEKRLTRFREDLVHLEATASQTRGKTRIEASLRLQLPSGVIAAHDLCSRDALARPPDVSGLVPAQSMLQQSLLKASRDS